MSDDGNLLDERLSELGRATASIRASRGFGARVRLAIETERSNVWRELVATSRRVLPAALMAAAVAVGWAFQAETAADEAVAVAYESAEVEF